MTIDDTSVSLAHQFNLVPAFFNEVSIDTLGFSVRVNNCLRKHDPPILTLEDLLNCSIDELKQIKSFGGKCVNEVLNSVAKIQEEYPGKLIVPVSHESSNLDVLGKYSGFIRHHLDDILIGDFGFLMGLMIDEEGRALANKVEKAYYDLGPEFVECLFNERKAVVPIIKLLREEANKYDHVQNMDSQFRYLLKKLPKERLDNYIEGFVFAYTSDDVKQQQLMDWAESNNFIVFRDIKYSQGMDDSVFMLVYGFLQWCSFDIRQEIQSCLEPVLTNERGITIVRMRAEGHSLKEIGETVSLTRERIRQIEAKMKRIFSSSVLKKRLLLKIYAIRNQDDVLTPAELKEYFGDNTKVVLYMLRTIASVTYTYDSDLDVFIVANEGLSERLSDFLELLPDTIHSNKIDKFIKIGIDEYDLSDEIILTAINKEFRISGNYYHRSRLKLSTVYDLILRKYYPNGIWVYGENEIRDFRNHVYEEFGDIQLASGDRALIARITDASILCDRGTYKAKEDKYISDELAESIFNYIENSESMVLMTNTIFSVFQDQLNEEGVNNKYYLQGILHELYGDKWVFRRDYISKDDNVTSLHGEIINYIKSSVLPITKQQIYHKFTGVTDIVVTIAVADPAIINLFGKYIHAGNVHVTNDDRDYLTEIIEELIGINGVCHCKEVYERIKEERPLLLSNCFIDSAFALFSLLEHEFSGHFLFSRPFITTLDKEIGTVANVLHELITSADEIDIADIRAFSKNHHLVIYSILDLINSCNETHLLADSSRVISIELTGIDEVIAHQIECIILAELKENETIPIANLQCVVSFPKIELQWNEWLIYSIIKKWCDSLDVGTSSNQFRYSVPLIARKGELNTTAYSGVSSETIGQVVMPDDLSNIDDLLMDLDEDDWGDQL